MAAPEEESLEFRSFWQRPTFFIPAGLICLLLLVVGLWKMEVFAFLEDQAVDRLGEARHLQRVIEEDDIEATPHLRLHKEVLPSYLAMMAQNPKGVEDPRFEELLAQMQRLAGDQELGALLKELHEGLLAGEREFYSLEEQWNRRLEELESPYALVGGKVEAHSHGHDGEDDGHESHGEQYQYLPETHRIHQRLEVLVDQELHEVQWRERLDSFRRGGVPTFYDERSETSWVRSDRSFATLWRVLSLALLNDDDFEGIEESLEFAWRQELQKEIHEALGEEVFGALKGGLVRAQHVREIANSIGARGSRCGHNYRIVRIPWLGFESDSLQRMAAIARADRFENCPRILEEEAAELRRLSRTQQGDRAYQEGLSRTTALLLTQKTYMAAAFAHRARSSSPLACEDCCEGCVEESLEPLVLSEVGGYLTGTLQGPTPLLGLFKLCFDHRYGDRASRNYWLRALQERGFRCRQGFTNPDLSFQVLWSKLEDLEERFSPIKSMEPHEAWPQEVHLSRRD